MVTDTTLTVNLVDVLDPPPVFGFREYSVEVAEGTYTNVNNSVICACVMTVEICSTCWKQFKQWTHFILLRQKLDMSKYQKVVA